MRWCAALVLVLVVVVVVGVRGLRRHQGRPPVAAPAVADEAPPPAPRRYPSSPAPDPPPRRESSGVAELRGRVLFPSKEEATSELQVVAEGGARKLPANVRRGQFQLRVPAGRYTLVATDGTLIGVVEDVLARAGTTRELDIRLEPGAIIRGRVRSQGFVEVSASPAGEPGHVGSGDVEKEDFTVEGLIPGRRYDLRFEGPTIRPTTIAGVTAPADDLDVELLPRAQIRGAIGFANGTKCPIETVELRLESQRPNDHEVDDDGASADVGRDCTFTLTVPDAAAAATVVATGPGWHLEESVAIPPEGDPDPICLNPPCRAHSEAEDRFAHLRVALDGPAAGMEMTAEVKLPGHGRGCFGTDGACVIVGLPAGETVAVQASAEGCRGAPTTVTLATGDNAVRIPCHRLRHIEGVIRTIGQLPELMTVRCAGESWRPIEGTRLFRLTCAADVATLEVRVGAGAVRSVPIAAADDADMAFVDVGL
jgi:hypothetical protein